MAKKLGIAAVLVIVAAVAFVWQGRSRQADERRERAEERLLSFDDRAVDGIDVVLEGTAYRFDLAADGWYLTAPIRDRADDLAVTELLSAIKQTRVTRTLDRPERLEEYGLDPARAEISVRGTDAAVLSLGDVVPRQDGRFARVSDRPGVVVVEVFPGSPMLVEDIVPFRQGKLTDGAAAAVTGLTLRGAGHDLALVRRDHGWWIERPHGLPASERAVARILDALDGAEVERYVDGADPADPGFGLSGGDTIVLEIGDVARTIRLGASGSPGTRYARRDDREAILVVSDDGLTDLPTTVEALLTRRVTKTNRYHVVEFDYRSGDKRFALRREHDLWSQEGDGATVEDGVAYAWLQRVLEAPVDGWADPPAPGSVPVAVIEYATEDGARDVVTWFEGGLAVLDSAPGFALRVSRPLPEVP